MEFTAYSYFEWQETHYRQIEVLNRGDVDRVVKFAPNSLVLFLLHVSCVYLESYDVRVYAAVHHCDERFAVCLFHIYFRNGDIRE